MQPPESATVVIPSYRRPEALRRCLDALVLQVRAPAQVVVAVHEGDADSRNAADAIRQQLPVESVTVPDRRVLSLMQAAIGRARSEIVAITDDDAAPQPEWLARMLDHYADATVGGVGGRDVIHDERLSRGGSASRVGVLQWFGRLIGEHDRGTGAPRDVEVLKGVNMSLRRELWRFDERLRGRGDQPHWELDVCLRARSEGWRLIYDPAVVVDHHHASRVEDDPRGELTSQRVVNWAHNELYALLKWLPWPRRLAAVAYAFCVGHRMVPGLLLVPERILRERRARAVTQRALAGALGRVLALRSLASRNAVRSDPDNKE